MVDKVGRTHDTLVHVRAILELLVPFILLLTRGFQHHTAMVQVRDEQNTHSSVFQIENHELKYLT